MEEGKTAKWPFSTAKSEKVEKEGKKAMAKVVLSDRIVLVVDKDCVLEVSEGGFSKSRNGKVEIGVSLKSVNEGKIERKFKAIDKTDKEIKAEVTIQNLSLAKTYKQELLDKAKQIGLSKDNIEVISAEVLLEDLVFIMS